MVRIILFSIFLFSFSHHAKSCCAGEQYSLVQLLLMEEEPRSIMIVTIDEAWMEADGKYVSMATVNKVYKHGPKTNKIRISSGSRNSSAGGRKLQAGVQVLLFSSSRDGYNYGGFVCDQFSQFISPDNKYPYQAINQLDVINQFYSKVETKYTGKVELKYNNVLLADGYMKKGLLNGNWKIYTRSKNKIERRVFSESNYKNGQLHGKTTTFSNSERSFQTDKWYKKGKLIKSQNFQKNGDSTFINYSEEVIHKPTYSLVTKTGRFSKEMISKKYQNIILPYNGSYPVVFRPIKHGPFIEYFENGQLKEQGEYYWGAKIGLWRTYQEDGRLRRKESFEKPIRSKELFTIFNENGTIKKQGKMVNNLPEGKWIANNTQGEKNIIAYFKKGKLDGELKKHRSVEGTIYELQAYKNGIREGVSIYYGVDGKTKLTVGYYKKGMRSGDWETYYNNGQLKEKKHFENGSFHGLRETFDKNGKLINTRNYDKGVYIGLHQSFDSQGVLIESGQYKNGIKHGKWKRFHASKQLYHVCYYDEFEGHYYGSMKMDKDCHYEDVDGNRVEE